MSRVVTPPPSGARRAISLGAALLLLALPGITPAAAQERPLCSEVSLVSDCVLSQWPEESLRDAPSLFGSVDQGIWVPDVVAGTPAGALDIQAVGIAAVEIDDAGAIRSSDDLMTLGKPGRAVRAGPAVLVRVVLDRPASAIEDGYSGVHVATDIDGARSNNAPASVARPDGPFAGLQDVYSLTYATTTGKTKLLDSDLSTGWYKGKARFAASWAAPNVLDVLVPAQAIGEGIKVITFVSGADGGYDSVKLGPASIPVDGQVGLVPVCAEASISVEPFTVRRLIENGQTLRDVEAPASWIGGAVIPVDEASRAALEAFVSAADDDDGDGRIALPATVSIFEDGSVIRQRPEVELSLDGDTVQLAVRLGLTRRGYSVVRDIRIRTTGDATVDAYLERAARALLEASPAFRSGKKSGLLNGAGIGRCATQLIAPPPPPTPPTTDDEAAPATEDGVAASA
ncbi:MAG: hypothetical protein ACC726_10660 [Chloroflexota bacterium]